MSKIMVNTTLCEGQELMVIVSELPGVVQFYKNAFGAEEVNLGLNKVGLKIGSLQFSVLGLTQREMMKRCRAMPPPDLESDVFNSVELDGTDNVAQLVDKAVGAGAKVVEAEKTITSAILKDTCGQTWMLIPKDEEGGSLTP